MESTIEKEIYNLRLVLNRMVNTDIKLTDDKLIRLSAELDKLLNTYFGTYITKAS